MKCYICNSELKELVIDYKNYKWGDKNTFKIEKAKANVCSKCGEITFNHEEAVRLQELSKTY